MLEPLTSAVVVLIKARCRQNDCREERRTRSDKHTHAHAHAQAHTHRRTQAAASSHMQKINQRRRNRNVIGNVGGGFLLASGREGQDFPKTKEEWFGWFGPEGRGVNSRTERRKEEARVAFRSIHRLEEDNTNAEVVSV